MGNVEFMDSSGVGAIVFLYKRLLSAGCSFEIKGAKGQPLQLLTYLRLDKLLIR
jgi:anti-anti-sigma regulatory factor